MGVVVRGVGLWKSNLAAVSRFLVTRKAWPITSYIGAYFAKGKKNINRFFLMESEDSEKDGPVGGRIQRDAARKCNEKMIRSGKLMRKEDRMLERQRETGPEARSCKSRANYGHLKYGEIGSGGTLCQYTTL